MGRFRYKQRLPHPAGLGRASAARLHRSLESARACQSAGRWEETEGLCRRILKVEPDHTEALYLLAASLSGRGNQDEAVELLSRAIQLAPSRVMLHGQIGAVLQAQGKHEEAVASFQQALALAPDDPDNYNNMGISQRALGRLEDAALSYRKALSLHGNTALLMNLAIVLCEQGKAEEAIATYRELLTILPNHADALQNLAHILRQQDQLSEALELYEKLLGFKPELACAHLNLGIALQNEDKLEEAVRCYRKVVEMEPDLAAAYNNLGSALRLQEKYSEAIATLEKAIALNPDLAVAHNNLGTALQGEKKWDEALAAFQRAQALAPQDLDAYNNIGNLYSAQGKFDLALEWYGQAEAIQPECPEVDNNAGNVLRDMGELDSAVARYRRALAQKPDFADAWSNMANALREQSKYAEAIKAYSRAISLKPNNAGFRWNKSLAELAAGDLDSGWAEYHWGFQCKQRQPVRDLPQAAWEGQSLTGKTVFAWGEQGVGDEIMFANSIPDLAATADRCVIECDPRLIPLFARSFSDCELVPRTIPSQPRTAWPDIDLQAPVGGLARWLRPTVAAFPRDRGYLQADPARIAHWKQRLAGLGSGLKVGISWRSRLMTPNRRKLCVALDEWDPILKTPAVQFVNLQYCDWADDLAAAESRCGVRVHHFEDLNLKDELDNVAALICALDLTITISNICMTMGGALDAETWVFAAEGHMSWVGLGTDYAPWFPSVRLFYRTWQENWERVVNAMAARLRQRAVSVDQARCRQASGVPLSIATAARRPIASPR